MDVQECTNFSMLYDTYVSRTEADLATGEFATRSRFTYCLSVSLTSVVNPLVLMVESHHKFSR
jgi:hypothetical protein